MSKKVKPVKITEDLEFDGILEIFEGICADLSGDMICDLLQPHLPNTHQIEYLGGGEWRIHKVVCV